MLSMLILRGCMGLKFKHLRPLAIVLELYLCPRKFAQLAFLVFETYVEIYVKSLTSKTDGIPT